MKTIDVKEPVVENGITWDKYCVQTMILTTSVFDNKVTVYAELWLCREVEYEENGEVKTKIEIQQPQSKVRSIVIDDLSQVDNVDLMETAIMDILKEQL